MADAPGMTAGVVDAPPAERLPAGGDGSSGFASSGGRLQSIDALRGVAALGVVLFHLRGVVAANPGSGWEAFAHSSLLFGRYGVWLFFVISGFCIHLRWARERVTNPQARLEFVPFWKRRVRRLYPPFLAAFVLYVACLSAEGMRWTGETVWRLGLNLLMLGNLDPGALNAVNGVFWTLAIEEQLYLAYFLLLALRVRYGWRVALTCALLARVAWFGLAMVLRRTAGVEILVTEAAASQWVIWALGALAVEAAFGLIRLPAWTRNGWLGTGMLAAAAGVCGALIRMPQAWWSDAAWLIGDLVWGAGFFVWINRAVEWERRRARTGRGSRWVASWAWLGVFSYSIYLTHEVVLVHGWPRLSAWLLPERSPVPMAAGAPLLTLASIGCAWLFFRIFERPFLSRSRTDGRVETTQAGEPMALALEQS